MGRGSSGSLRSTALRAPGESITNCPGANPGQPGTRRRRRQFAPPSPALETTAASTRTGCAAGSLLQLMAPEEARGRDPAGQRRGGAGASPWDPAPGRGSAAKQPKKLIKQEPTGNRFPIKVRTPRVDEGAYASATRIWEPA